jgi:hypothetical protein
LIGGLVKGEGGRRREKGGRRKERGGRRGEEGKGVKKVYERLTPGPLSPTAAALSPSQIFTAVPSEDPGDVVPL